MAKGKKPFDREEITRRQQERENETKRDAAEASPRRAARFIEEQRSYFRLVVAGNAGGIVATLGLIGTMLGASDDGRGPIPIPIFAVLVVFIIGFLTAMLTQSLNARIAGDASFVAYMRARFGLDLSGVKFLFWKERTVVWGERVAMLCFLVGSLGGLWQLWQFATALATPGVAP